MRVALYLRLSDEDIDKLDKYQFSESIKNQEVMLRNYAIDNNWEIVGVYQDEDYSGADRDRPNFNKMIKECEIGNVDIVLVKTQARFARDIELIDKYVHNKFYEWNVRFITYLEKIDNSKKETKKTSQITSMVDEWYIEDTSINIRETLKAKRENGEFTGSFAPYGYKKEINNKNHLIVDNTVSHIVKNIYLDYLNGKSLTKIANNLNQENVLSPLEYKKSTGSKLQIPFDKNIENYTFLKQNGFYKVIISYINKERKTIKNNTIYQQIINYDNHFNITLVNYSKDKIDLFYTNSNSIIEDSLESSDWKKITIGNTLPPTLTYIAIHIKELQFSQSLFFNFDIQIKNNSQHQIYYFNFLYPNQIRFHIIIRKRYNWSIQTIKKILTNEFYIGNLVQFKSTHVSYKNHTLIHNDESKWIRASNTHEAIIEKSIWNQVQQKLNRKARSTKTGDIHPLSQKIFCMECEKKFMKSGRKHNGYGYFCCSDKLNKWENCHNKKYLKEVEIEGFLLEKINILIQTFLDQNEIMKLQKDNKEKSSTIDEEYQFLLNKLQEKDSYFIKIYEDYMNGFLNDSEFLLLKQKYNDNIDKIKSRISSIENKIQYISKKKNENQNVSLCLKQIDPLFIEKFIYRIYIGTYNQSNNSRKIKIEWNFKEE